MRNILVYLELLLKILSYTLHLFISFHFSHVCSCTADQLHVYCSLRNSLLFACFFFLSCSFSFSLFHLSPSNYMAGEGQERETWGERERKRDTEREGQSGGDESQGLKLENWSFSLGPPLLLTPRGTEYKLKHLPAYACYDTQGDSEIKISRRWVQRRLGGSYCLSWTCRIAYCSFSQLYTVYCWRAIVVSLSWSWTGVKYFLLQALLIIIINIIILTFI